MMDPSCESLWFDLKRLVGARSVESGSRMLEDGVGDRGGSVTMRLGSFEATNTSLVNPMDLLVLVSWRFSVERSDRHVRQSKAGRCSTVRRTMVEQPRGSERISKTQLYPYIICHFLL